MIGRAKNRRRKQKGESRFQWRLPAIDWKRLGATVASLAAIGGVCAMIAWALDQPIETVDISGRFQRVSPVDVERVVKSRVAQAGLVTADLADVRQALHGLPWVDDVTVARAWPRGLRVSIVEQVAAARWNEAGLLNTRGELFVGEARFIPPELPRLSGPPGTENVVAQRYLAAQGRLVEAGMRMTALRLDPRGAWEMDLDNGVTVRLGRKQVDQRFDTFVTSALKLVAEKAGDISYVDMRYTNGFAVGWRSGQATAPANEEGNQDA